MSAPTSMMPVLQTNRGTQRLANASVFLLLALMVRRPSKTPRLANATALGSLVLHPRIGTLILALVNAQNSLARTKEAGPTRTPITVSVFAQQHCLNARGMKMVNSSSLGTQSLANVIASPSLAKQENHRDRTTTANVSATVPPSIVLAPTRSLTPTLANVIVLPLALVANSNHQTLVLASAVETPLQQMIATPTKSTIPSNVIASAS